MKKLAVLLCCLMLVSMAGCTGSSTSNSPGSSTDNGAPLVVAMELAYPPFETKDDNGDPTGVSADFAKAFGEYVGREVKIEDIAWDGLIPSLQTGKADMVISSMTITEERKETVDFSDPYANALLAILANKNAGVASIDDLNQAGKKVAVKTGTTGDIYAQNHLNNAKIIRLTDVSACITEVVQGKADAFIYDQLTIYRNWKDNEDATEAIFIPFQDVEQWGVAVKKGNTELLGQINAFIEKYTSEGGFGELTKKYLSEEKKAFDKLGFQWFFDIES